MQESFKWYGGGITRYVRPELVCTAFIYVVCTARGRCVRGWTPAGCRGARHSEPTLPATEPETLQSMLTRKKRDKKYNPLRHLKHTKIKTFAQYLNCIRVKCQSYSREELRRLVFFRSYVKSVQSPVECSLCTFFSLCESCTAPRTHARHAHRECKSG